MSDHICIIAAEVITSLGVGLQSTWDAMMQNTCGIRRMGRFQPGRYRIDVAAELTSSQIAELRTQEAPAFGLAALLALWVGRRALGKLPAERGCQTDALVLATTKAEVSEIELGASRQPHGALGHWNPGSLARTLASELGVSGPVVAVPNACISGLLAIIHAARLLRRGQASRVLVIGVDVLSDFVLAGFSRLGALSPRPCRPYDKHRDGLSLGEGAAALVLELDPHGIPALAAVSGWGIANDAQHITRPSPTGRGLTSAVAASLNMAGWLPSSVQYVNGHGTATPQNDEMEAQGLHAVFGDGGPPVSSMKGYFGHTLGAAGVIETALSLQAMRAGTIPASLGLIEPGISTPLDLPREHRLIRRLERVLTLKSGFGGVNAAIALEMLTATTAAHQPILLTNAPRQLRVVITAVGYADAAGFGAVDRHTVWQPGATGPAGATWRELSHATFDRFGRLDLPSKCVAIAAEMLALPALCQDQTRPEMAIVLATRLGSLDTDTLFYSGVLSPIGPSPTLFSYTLPGMPMAEVAIRLGITGESHCMMSAEPDALLSVDEGLCLVAEGHAESCVCIECNACGTRVWETMRPEGFASVPPCHAYAFLVQTPEAAHQAGRRPLATIAVVAHDPQVLSTSLSPASLRDWLCGGSDPKRGPRIVIPRSAHQTGSVAIERCPEH